MTTTKNPLNIDFANITKVAEQRVSNLEALSELIAHNIESMCQAVEEVDSVLGMLTARWTSLDAEGRALLPEDVRKVLGHHQSLRDCVNHLLGYTQNGLKVYGLHDLRQFAVPK